MSTDQTARLTALVEDLQDEVRRLDDVVYLLRDTVRHLEDIEALRNLKAEYAAACDDNFDPDRLDALFVEDATWESEGWSDTREGRPFWNSYAEFPATLSLLCITG